MLFEDETATEQFVAFGVGRISELGKNFEVRFLHRNRSNRARTILQKKHVPNPWSRRRTKSILAKRGPQIERAAHCFFGAVIEIVAEGWPDLRLRLQCRNELGIHDDDEVPLFIGTEVSRQFQRLIVENVRPINSCFDDETGKEFDEAVHLGAACDSAAES